MRLAQRAGDLFGLFPVWDFGLLSVNSRKASIECGRFRCREVRIDRPIFLLLERLDLAFTFDDQPKSNCLHTPSREATTHLVPQKRRNLITHNAVEDATRLLRVDKIPVNFPRMFESGFYCLGRDFIERHAVNGNSPTTLLLGLGIAQFLVQMGCDGLAFAVRVGR